MDGPTALAVAGCTTLGGRVNQLLTVNGLLLLLLAAAPAAPLGLPGAGGLEV